MSPGLPHMAPHSRSGLRQRSRQTIRLRRPPGRLIVSHPAVDNHHKQLSSNYQSSPQVSRHQTLQSSVGELAAALTLLHDRSTLSYDADEWSNPHQTTFMFYLEPLLAFRFSRAAKASTSLPMALLCCAASLETSSTFEACHKCRTVMVTAITIPTTTFVFLVIHHIFIP